MMEGSEIQTLCKSKAIDDVQNLFSLHKNALKGRRTAHLWLQYMQMVDLLRKYVRAERLGNWLLHHKTTMEMLPYFAASGHNNYLKSSHIHLQKMLRLQESHPDIYHHFC